jgi:hypothetical protein
MHFRAGFASLFLLWRAFTSGNDRCRRSGGAADGHNYRHICQKRYSFDSSRDDDCYGSDNIVCFLQRYW